MTTNNQSVQSASIQSDKIPFRSWLIKFIPLGLMQMFGIFCYNCLRTLKDSVIINFIGDASTFNWLKTFVIMPLSLGIVMFISIMGAKLGNRRHKLNYILLSIFLVYYATFIFILLPAESSLQFPGLPARLLSLGFIPKGVADGLGNVVGYWAFSIFYGMSEIFGATVIQVVCWGTASTICKKEERDKFYPAFAFMSQLGGLAGSGMLSRIGFAKLDNNQFKQMLSKILLLIISFIGVIAAIYYFIEINVINKGDVPGRGAKSKEKTATPGFKETFGIILSNPYIRKIAMIVFAYNVSIALVEVCWKDAITTTYGRSAYASIHSATLAINAVTTIIMATFSTIVLSRFSLVVRAMLPIFMMGVTAILFLFFFIFSDFEFTKEIMLTLGLTMYTPIQLSVIMGCIQNIGAKSAKYSTFDSSKEEMLAALDQNEFNRGKSAVDVVVARGGKSFSGMIQVFLLVVVPIISSMFVSPLGNIKTTQKTIIEAEKAPSEVNEDNKKAAAKRILEAISALQTSSDDDNKKFSVSIPKNEGIEFSITKDELIISTNIEEKAVDQNADLVKSAEKKTNQKMIAPYLLFFLTIFISMWAYAVISIYPEYKERIRRQKMEEKGESEAEGSHIIPHVEEASGFSFREVIYLILLSFTICGTLFYFTSKSIRSILISGENAQSSALKKASEVE